MRQNSRSSVRRPLTSLVAGALAVGLAACGSGSGTDGAEGGTPTLNVSVAAAVVTYLPFWVAKADKLFEKHGVKVNVVNSNALAVGPSLLTSGETDLLISSSGQTVAVAGTGQPVKLVYNLLDYSPRSTAFMGGRAIDSIEDLKAKGSDCKLGVTQRGTAYYAMGNQVQRAYGLRCGLVEVSTTPAIQALLTSGQADAGFFSPSDAGGVVSKGGHYLWDPTKLTDAEVTGIVPKTFPVLTVTGLAPNLKAKSDAVGRFLAALDDGLAEAHAKTPDELAALVLTLPDFPGATAEQLSTLLTPLMSVVPEDGTISEDAWAAALDSYEKDFAIPGFKASDSKYAYGEVVDMTYLTAAKGK